MKKHLIIGALLLVTIFAFVFAERAQAATILFPSGGGTGWGLIQTGGLLYGNGAGRLATTTQGTGGQYLVWSGGIPTWVASTTYSGSGLISLTFAGGAVTAGCSTCIALGSLSGVYPIIYNSGTGAFSSGFGTTTTAGLGLSKIVTTDSSGVIVGSSTIGNGQLQNSSVVVNTTYPITGGVTLSLGGTITIASAVATTSSNTWANTQTFTNPIVDGTLTGLISGNSGTTYAAATSTLSGSGGVTVTAGASVISPGAITVACATCVLTSRNVNTTYPLQGGGALSGDLTLTNAFGTTSSTGLPVNAFVYTSNSGVLTTAASSTLSLPNTALQNSAVTINSSGGLTGGGSVSLGGSLSLNVFTWPFTAATSFGTTAATTSILYPAGLAAGTSTIGTLTATSSITNFGVKSALVLNSSTGLEGAYGGAAACTNQFVTALSALGATTCASINNGQWSGSQLTVGNGGTGLTGVSDGNLLFGGIGGGTANLVALATSTGGFLSNDYTTGRPAWKATSTLNIIAATGGAHDQFIFNNFGQQTGLSLSTASSTGGWLSFGTSTTNWLQSYSLLTLGTSTRPQLTLTDNSATSNNWIMRAINGWFYLASSSPSTLATSTGQAAFHISNGGEISGSACIAATSTTMTLDWTGLGTGCNDVTYRMSTSAYTITLINATTSDMVGSGKVVTVCNNQSTGTGGAITWVGVEWSGGTAPTQTTTAGACDVYSFRANNASSTIKVFGMAGTNFQ